MKWLIAALLVLLAGLQYRLWVGEGSLAHIAELEQKIVQQRADNDHLREQNQVLAVEVKELKSGLDGVEERARKELGMIKEGETFYMVVEKKK